MNTFTYSAADGLMNAVVKNIPAEGGARQDLLSGNMHHLATNEALRESVRDVERYYAGHITLSTPGGLSQLVPKGTPATVVTDLLKVCTEVSSLCYIGGKHLGFPGKVPQAYSGSHSNWLVCSIALRPELSGSFLVFSELLSEQLGGKRSPEGCARLMKQASDTWGLLAPLVNARGMRTAKDLLSRLASLANRLESLGKAKLASLVDAASNTVDLATDKLRAELERYTRGFRPEDHIPASLHGNWVMFDLETSGLANDKGNQVTQIAATIISVPGYNSLGSSLNLKARLTPRTESRLEYEVESVDKPLKGYSPHGALAINQYHPHFQPEIDPATGEQIVDEVTGDNGTVYKNKRFKRLTPGQLREVKRHSDALPEEEDVLKEFQGFCAKHNVKGYIGHNIQSFDIPFINSRLELYNLPTLHDAPLYDTVVFSRMAFIPALQTLKYLSDSIKADTDGDENEVDRIYKILAKGGPHVSSQLQDLREALGVAGGTAHDAMGDVETNVLVLRALDDFMDTYARTLEKELSSVHGGNQQDAMENSLQREIARNTRIVGKL